MKPKATPPSSELIAPFTAFPNVLLDAVMPTLKDTEWRLVCVIVRQTIGWSDKSGRRKSRDWLTQGQLMKRTGRNSAALSAALDALVSRRLVNAWDEAGEMLLTPAQRRRHQGRIYYGLCQETLQALSENASKTPLRKVNTTKENQDKKEFIKKMKLTKLQPRAEDVRVAPHLYTGWTQAGHVAASRYEPEHEG